MDWQTISQFVLEQKWLPLAIFIVGYLVRLTNDDSKFPITVPQQWHPVVALFVAQVYGVLVAWPNWHPAVQPALIVALAVLAVKAHYNGNDPEWFKWLARVMSPQEQASKAVDKAAILTVKASLVPPPEDSAHDTDPPPPPAS